ncbi:MAG: hypothetical protein ABW321_05060 [Polyangiales bacterium]
MASHRSFRLFYRVLGACLGIGTAACGGVAHDLHAATELYRDARYEAVQAWIAQLRNEYADMSRTQRAEFHYLSGMTAYRLAQPDEALHELALAAHAARERPCPPCALGNEQLALLYRTLEELMANRFKAAR